MLIGGIDVIGIFVFGPPEMLNKVQSKLRRLIFAIHKAVFRKPAGYFNNPTNNRIVLQICSQTKKYPLFLAILWQHLKPKEGVGVEDGTFMQWLVWQMLLVSKWNQNSTLKNHDWIFSGVSGQWTIFISIPFTLHRSVWSIYKTDSEDDYHSGTIVEMSVLLKTTLTQTITQDKQLILHSWVQTIYQFTKYWTCSRAVHTNGWCFLLELLKVKSVIVGVWFLMLQRCTVF